MSARLQPRPRFTVVILRDAVTDNFEVRRRDFTEDEAAITTAEAESLYHGCAYVTFALSIIEVWRWGQRVRPAPAQLTFL